MSASTSEKHAPGASRRIRGRLDGTPERPRVSRVPLEQGDLRAARRRRRRTARWRRALGEVDGAGLKKSEVAKKVGELLAQRAKDKGIERVVFDRSGYLYHGRVKALAEGAREGGLVF